MRKKRKKSYKEIACKTIDSDNLILDTTRKESFQVFEFCASMRKYLISILFISSVISAMLSLQFILGYQLFSSQLAIINIIAIAFVGFCNVFCGLLLLSSE
jgi:hypothetical protein